MESSLWTAPGLHWAPGLFSRNTYLTSLTDKPFFFARCAIPSCQFANFCVLGFCFLAEARKLSHGADATARPPNATGNVNIARKGVPDGASVIKTWHKAGWPLFRQPGQAPKRTA